MKEEKPIVSIGLPVYNGQRYIRAALESLISQSFTDFELIVCDNASMDSTHDICMEFVQRDGRVRYHRNDVNLGASANFNKAFSLSRGRHFKWASYDDMCGPGFLQKCVEVLDNDDSIVLSYPRTTEIDKQGEKIRDFDWYLNLGAESPSERFRELLVGHSACYEIFGVIRSDVLRNTNLIGPYIGSDRKLLSELALRGRFFEIPQYLFLRRNHEATSWDTMSKTPTELARWFDTSVNRRIVMPTWKLFTEYVRVIVASQVSYGEKMHCLGILMRWLRINRRYMQSEVLHAAKTMARSPIHQSPLGTP